MKRNVVTARRAVGERRLIVVSWQGFSEKGSVLGAEGLMDDGRDVVPADVVFVSGADPAAGQIKFFG